MNIDNVSKGNYFIALLLFSPGGIMGLLPLLVTDPVLEKRGIGGDAYTFGISFALLTYGLYSGVELQKE